MAGTTWLTRYSCAFESLLITLPIFFERLCQMLAKHALLVLAVVLLLAAAFLWWHGESTCVLLFGQPADWLDFIAGVRRVIPMAEVVLLRDPEVDYSAYLDCMEDCSGRFRHMVCQVPNARASRLLAARRGVTVCVNSDPKLLPPGKVVCNIVGSEQSLANALVSRVPARAGAKRLLIGTDPYRTPPGWRCIRVPAGSGPETALQQLSGTAFDVVAVTDPRLASLSSVYALRAAMPSASVLLAATETDQVIPELEVQVRANRQGAGVLAAAMCRLGAGYHGQQTLTVDPVVVKPAVRLETPPVTSLRALRRLACQ